MVGAGWRGFENFRNGNKEATNSNREDLSFTEIHTLLIALVII